MRRATPRRLCQDCTNTVLPPARRCPTCTQAHTRARNARPVRRLRDDARWRQLSRAARAAQPWCTTCRATQDLTLDHVVPLAQGGDPWAPSNLQVLCRGCQNRKGDQQTVDRRR